MKRTLVLVALLLAATLLGHASAPDQQGSEALTGNTTDVRAELLDVSFAGGWNLRRDDGSSYGAPHWRASPASRSPYRMKAGDTLIVANARIRVRGTVSRAIEIRGWRDDGRDIPPTRASQVAGRDDVYEIANVRANAPFTPNVITSFNTFDLEWLVSSDAGRTWLSAGVSRNPVYVCLAAGGTSDEFLTIVAMACS